MAFVSKTGRKGANAHFPAKSAPAPTVVRRGGHSLGTPKHCAAKRAHGNVVSGY